MNTADYTHSLSDNFIDSRRLITGLKQALDVNYTRVLDAARDQWERYVEGNDPSDACVSVRITSGKPMAGVIRKPAATLIYGAPRLTA